MVVYYTFVVVNVVVLSFQDSSYVVEEEDNYIYNNKCIIDHHQWGCHNIILDLEDHQVEDRILQQ
jgi:hypothetical protein